ncbi:MAG: VolA/Pla-1 family phospholipase [Pseudomonadota bacterium]|uniref:VolA/Pla-1 family phospholipase n=1 Tax=Gallaecimonas pentaromativorans TaxID=584787 RepID=UPI00067EB381|nr:VolA/Pla-1 family phospholipase [Gallaecimonas pentaromativorans]MED5523849.1 VolA/Pla-1 family phospholipase [Pseudomonadota bacterium]
MDKKFVSIAVLAALGLSACGDDSYSETPGTDNSIATARIAYDPSNGVLPIPNDLLLSGTTDGTLNIPGVADESSPYDPQAVLSGMDGWSLSTPFTISVDLPTGLTLDEASVQQAGAVVLLKVTKGGEDANCADASSVDACTFESALTFGTDFTTAVTNDNTIAIVPLKPLDAKSAYVVATTSLVHDSEGRSVQGSATYNLLKQDVETTPLGTADQLSAQTAVNSYEKVLAAAGIDKDSVTYSGLFTTQSTIDTLNYAKLVLMQTLQAGQLSLSALTDTGMTAADVLGLDGSTTAGQLASGAEVYKATLSLPYFLDKPTAADFASGACNIATGDLTQCDALSSRWIASGDSPAAVLLALQNGTLSQANYAQQAANQGIDPTAALTNNALLVGASFTNDAGNDVDPLKFITKYNPVPKVRSIKTIDVLVTLPIPSTVNTLRGALSMDGTIAKGAAGWPTVVYGHGITSYKETGLAIAGTLALNGQAMIAIDLPLHGTRGLDLTGDGQENLNAGDNVGIYTNLASLGTVRDNLRESVMDELSLRAALTAQTLGGGTTLDGTDVSYMGISLGSIVGSEAVAVGNTETKDPSGNDYSAFFSFKTAALSVPGAGVAGIFAFSPAFAATVQDGLVASSSFQTALAAANTNNLQPGDAGYEQLVDAVYEQFLPQFLFAAQTVLDSADPIAYGVTLKGNTPGLLVHEVVGNGTTGTSDQVIPNSNAAFGYPLSGTDPLVASLGLSPITATLTSTDGTTQVSGVAHFNAGAHTSLLSPASSAAVTTEMQTQVASFLASKGLTILVTNSAVLADAAQD